jgi:hypothetical protein
MKTNAFTSTRSMKKHNSNSLLPPTFTSTRSRKKRIQTLSFPPSSFPLPLLSSMLFFLPNLPQFGDMHRGLEVVLDGGGLDDPLILAIAAAIMEELRGGVGVGGVDEIGGVLHIGALHAEALDEHGESKGRVREGEGKGRAKGEGRRRNRAKARGFLCVSCSASLLLLLLLLRLLLLCLCSSLALFLSANKGLFISRLVFLLLFFRLFFHSILIIRNLRPSLHAVHLDIWTFGHLDIGTLGHWTPWNKDIGHHGT